MIWEIYLNVECGRLMFVPCCPPSSLRGGSQTDATLADVHCVCASDSYLANRGGVLLHLLQEVSQKAPVGHGRLKHPLLTVQAPS